MREDRSKIPKARTVPYESLATVRASQERNVSKLDSPSVLVVCESDGSEASIRLERWRADSDPRSE
jgi:hypothetical protein